MAFWVDSLSVGVPALDAEHRQFLELCDTYRAATDEALLAEAADQILRHSLDHFAHEEALLVEAGYARLHPGPFMVHVREHHTLGGQIRAVLQTHANASNLIALLVEHLLRHDMKYKEFMLRRGAAP